MVCYGSGLSAQSRIRSIINSAMNRNRRIFIIIFISFTAIVALFAIDMARRTTAPWNKRRQVERAFEPRPVAPLADSLALDSL
jgi:hypothetical protein